MSSVSPNAIMSSKSGAAIRGCDAFDVGCSSISYSLRKSSRLILSPPSTNRSLGSKSKPSKTFTSAMIGEGIIDVCQIVDENKLRNKGNLSN